MIQSIRRPAQFGAFLDSAFLDGSGSRSSVFQNRGPQGERRDFAWTLRLWVRRGPNENMQSVPTDGNDAFRRNRAKTIFDLDQRN